MWFLAAIGYVIGAVIVNVMYGLVQTLVTGLLLTPTAVAQEMTANKPKVSGIFAIFNIAAIGIAGIIWWFIELFVIFVYTMIWAHWMPDYTIMFLIFGGIWLFES